MRLKNRLSVSKNSYGFLFYAGHGVQSGGVNYLIPVGASIPSENSLRDRAVSVQCALNELNDAGNELNVVVLDACRDNPFGWARGGSRGLTVIANQPADSIIVYATSAGSTAADGSGRNGLFTSHLLNNLKTPGLEIKEVFNRTGADVALASERRQIPSVYNQFFGNAYFLPIPSPDINVVQAPPPSSPDISTTQPVVSATQPIVSTTQPIVSATQPVVSTTQPMPLPSEPKTGNPAVNYGFMNIAFGLGSYLQGDTAGGVIVTGGYAAAIGLIAWELVGLSRGDSLAGVPGPIGVGVAVATAVFGFIKPNLYIKNTRMASVMDRVSITAVSAERGVNVIGISYKHSY
jgi:hypothetical protein